MEGEITGVRRREDRHNRHERSLERLPEPVWMKRGKVAEELLETERAFVQSLRLVNEVSLTDCAFCMSLRADHLSRAPALLSAPARAE